MKRYWAFAYDTYYPGGGLEDCIGQFETREAAEKALKEYLVSDHSYIVYIGDDYTPTDL